MTKTMSSKKEWVCVAKDLIFHVRGVTATGPDLSFMSTVVRANSRMDPSTYWNRTKGVIIVFYMFTCPRVRRTDN